MKSQKGITLIALVITIIVMLILVAVTITMAINGGLFDYAKDASTQTNTEIQAEKKLGNGTVTVDGLNEGNIDQVVNFYTNGTTF